jgi:cytoskeletal protein CcmA (bactofilin family)
MWGKNDNISSSKIDTFIAKTVEIQGDVKFSSGLQLDGKITGNVTTDEVTDAVLIVTDKGRIEGDVSVTYAAIDGEVIGNVYATEKLELSGGARITGNVHYNLLEMASGAEVNGKMLHDGKKQKKRLEHQNVKTEKSVHNMDQPATAQGSINS